MILNEEPNDGGFKMFTNMNSHKNIIIKLNYSRRIVVL